MISGLRNLIQNAVDVAENSVWVDIRWGADEISVTISDDGPGYPTHLIGRIGDPFVRQKGRRSDQRPEYEGMGLGLFIAKTLLERSGGELTFANGTDPFLTASERPERKGAVVEVVWAREKIVATENDITQSFEENQLLGI